MKYIQTTSTHSILSGSNAYSIGSSLRLCFLTHNKYIRIKTAILCVIRFVFSMWVYTTILGTLLCTHFTSNVEARTKKSKSVTTLLEAKWEVTPLVLEVAEYLADENVDFYWSFIDSISSLSPTLVEIGT